MKFNVLTKTLLIVLIIVVSEVSASELSISMGKKLQKAYLNGGVRNPTNSRINQNLNANANFPNAYRFQDYEKMNAMTKKNPLMLNSDVLNAKPPTDKDDVEADVRPNSANAGSYFTWTFLWWTIMTFPPSNALRGDGNYWLSTVNREHDHWEAVFDQPQKIDVIDIKWRLAPKRFRVFIKLDENSEYIPVTGVFEKTSFINKEGKISSKDAVSEMNAIVFNKPIFAKRVRINLNEPLKHRSFSIFYVKFFQKRNTILIKNELIDSKLHYCMYVNTDYPVNGSKVEMYPCLKALSLANNNELWIYYNDSSIRHYNSKLCLGFDVENDLTLRNCGDYNPAFTVKLRLDNSLYFTGYQDKCIAVSDKKQTSSSFIDEDTDVTVTSQADLQTFKKENIKFDGENYWHSAPGQKKATMQIFFGKIKKGNNKGKIESKKVDMIKIEWVREPKKFMIYTWKPGHSWILRQVYDDYKSKTSEITIVGDDAAAIMIVMDEAHVYPELGNIAAFAIREVSVTYNSMKLKNDICSNFSSKLKIFDFDTQKYHKLENTKDYEEVRKKMSIVFEKMISNYTSIKKFLKKIAKAKSKAVEIVEKINNMKKSIAEESIKQLKIFKSDTLSQIKNSMFRNYLNTRGARSFMLGLSKKRKGNGGKIGTKDKPATDCLNIRKLQKNSLSGWYYIKNDCSPKAIRVFCDFTIYKDAVDIFIFNDDTREPNPDLSYLDIKDFNSIRYQCSKNGLYPLQIMNKDMVTRVYQVITSMGYDLSKPVVVPLGYDYSCSNGAKCRGMINSLNDKETPLMKSFFVDAGGKSGAMTKPGAFAGLGYSNNASMISFEPHEAKITGMVCSTNHFETNSLDTSVKTISCELSAAANGDIFIEGSSVLVECPSACHNSPKHTFGTNQYHLNSSVCKAAIHTGVMGSSGGKVYVRVGKGIKKYLGSSANGVTTEDFESNDGMNSFSLLKYDPKCPIDQYKELAKADSQAQEEKSSFLELGMKSSLKNSFSHQQAHEQFEKDLMANDFEGVDMEDIRKAGLKAQTENAELARPDNDVENYNYNSGQMTQNDNTGSDANQSGEMSDMNGMVNYNNEHGMTDNSLDMNNVDYDQSQVDSSGSYKFSQVQSEASTEENSGLETDSECLLGLESETNLNTDLETFSYTENMTFQGARDRLTSEDPNKKKDNMVSGMMNSINSAKDKMTAVAGNVLNKVAARVPPPSDIPEKPIEAKLPAAPKPNQTNPPVPEEKVEMKPGERGPTTDEGNAIVQKIRKVVDWDYLTIVEKKTKKVKERIDQFRKYLSWSREGSKLSMTFIKKSLAIIEKYKMKVASVMKRLSDESLSRVLKTKKIKYVWREELNKLESKNDFKIDYSIDPEILLKKIFVTLDSKCPIKSNWKVHKEGLKERARAIGITSKIFSKDQIGASILAVNGREYYDFKLSVDILVKANGSAGIIFRMRDEYNYYAFVIDKLAGTKSIVKVKNGKNTVLKTVKDGGILVNNWHRVEISVNATQFKIFIYDTEQVNKTKSEKTIEVTDQEFPNGGVGLFVNSMDGFFIDELKIKAEKCWTPWTPKKKLGIKVPLSSVYYEDFAGTIDSKFEKNEPENVQEGPPSWSINQYASLGIPLGLYQRSMGYDKSSQRRPLMMIKKKKQISNGTVSVTFTPYNTDGTVSIAFKYLANKNPGGETSEMFYLFEAINHANSPQFVLRKFQNGLIHELIAVNAVPKGMQALGYVKGVPHSVHIETLGENIRIRMSINNQPMTEIMHVKDSSIPYGLIGVGTYKVKCSFSNLEIFPPLIPISEAEKTKIMTSDSIDIFLPPMPAEWTSTKSNKDKSSGTNDDKSNNINSVKGLVIAGGAGEGNNLGIKNCLINNTVKDRKGYCNRTFNVQAAKDRCEGDFCDTCCDHYTNKAHKSSMWVCKKACNRATISEPAKDDYKAVCITSQNPLNSIYDYCDNKISDPESKKTCKLDMCNLCCSTLDTIQHKKYSINSIKKCFETCSGEFNK